MYVVEHITMSVILFGKKRGLSSPSQSLSKKVRILEIYTTFEKNSKISVNFCTKNSIKIQTHT